MNFEIFRLCVLLASLWGATAKIALESIIFQRHFAENPLIHAKIFVSF